MLCTMMNCWSSAHNTCIIVPKNTATEGLFSLWARLKDLLSKVIKMYSTVKITANNTKPLDSVFNLTISQVHVHCLGVTAFARLNFRYQTGSYIFADILWICIVTVRK